MALSLTRTALSSSSHPPGSRIDRLGTWPKRPTNVVQGSGTNGLDHEAREERLRRRKRRNRTFAEIGLLRGRYRTSPAFVPSPSGERRAAWSTFCCSTGDISIINTARPPQRSADSLIVALSASPFTSPAPTQCASAVARRNWSPSPGCAQVLIPSNVHR